MSAFTTVIVTISKTNTKSLTVGRNLIEYFLIQNRCFLRFWSWRCRRFRTVCFVCFDCPASTPREYIWHFHWTKCMATVGSAIVCHYMETGFLLTMMETALFAIVCDSLRSYGNQPLVNWSLANWHGGIDRFYWLRWEPCLVYPVRAKLQALFKLVNIMKTIWYFIIFGSASVYSRDIYTSINWDPRNPMWVFGFCVDAYDFRRGISEYSQQTWN